MRHYRHQYRRLSAEQLQDGLDEVGMTPDEFCLATGTNRRRLMLWLHGEEEPPPHVPVILALMTLEGGREMALQVARLHLLSEDPGDLSGH